VRVSMFRRGKTWWARYSQAGKDVRRSLKTVWGVTKLFRF